MPKYKESFTFTAIGTEPDQSTFDRRIWNIFMPVLEVQLKAHGYELFYKAKRNDFTKDNPYSHSEEVMEHKLLTMNDIKEGMTLIALDDYNYYEQSRGCFHKNHEYKVYTIN